MRYICCNWSNTICKTWHKILISDTKFYTLVATLWSQDTEKLLEQLKLGFNQIIPAWNQYLDSSFQAVNNLFMLLFENNANRIVNWRLPSKIRKQDRIIMIDSWNFFDQPVKHDTRTYENIKKAATGQGND